MIRHVSDAERAAFAAVPETCPHVDAALEVASEAIKAQTGALRAALVAAIEARDKAVADIAAIRAGLSDEIRDLIREVRWGTDEEIIQAARMMVSAAESIGAHKWR